MPTRRSVVTTVFLGLSGCTSSLSDGTLQDGGSTDESSVCRKIDDDFEDRQLLVLRPAEPASEETWAEIRRVAKIRSMVMAQRVYDGDVNGSRAIVVLGPPNDFEEDRELLLSETTFSLYLGTAETMREVTNDSMNVTTAGGTSNATDGWDVPMLLGESGEKRVRSVLENTSGELRVRTVVNGEIVDERSMPEHYRSFSEERSKVYLKAYVPNEMMGKKVAFAPNWPPFPVELEVSTHRCRDDKDE